MSSLAGSDRAFAMPIDALGHLAGGLVGEGQGDDAARGDAPLDEPGDALRDDARLARAGAGQDQERTDVMFDRAALRGVQRNRCRALDPLARVRTGTGRGHGSGCHGRAADTRLLFSAFPAENSSAGRILCRPCVRQSPPCAASPPALFSPPRAEAPPSGDPRRRAAQRSTQRGAGAVGGPVPRHGDAGRDGGHHSRGAPVRHRRRDRRLGRRPARRPRATRRDGGRAHRQAGGRGRTRRRGRGARGSRRPRPRRPPRRLAARAQRGRRAGLAQSGLRPAADRQRRVRDLARGRPPRGRLGLSRLRLRSLHRRRAHRVQPQRVGPRRSAART